MATKRGELVYMIYRAITHGLSPLIHLHLRWRKFQGLEHPLRWRERLGRPSLPRPPGPLIWFHAVSLGEGMSILPVIKRCVERRPDITVLMTTTTLSAFEVIKNLLPTDVIYQFAPVDTPSVMNAFLEYWKPNAIMLTESELWPNLVLSASKCGILIALLNARMSMKSFDNWSRPVVHQLITLMLSKFSLIAPLSSMQGIGFQLLQASPFVINYCGDLKYGIEETLNSNRDMKFTEDLQVSLAHRRVWMASSMHKGEEEVLLAVHKELKEMHPDLLMIIVPRHPQLGMEIAVDLWKVGVSVALRSRCEPISQRTSVYVVDTLGELRHFYRLIPIAVIGGSFLPGLTGHNISEAAAAGCAVLTGHHVGHFSHMIMAMHQLNPLSVVQVGGKSELQEILNELLSNPNVLEARRTAAKQAFDALSNGVIENVWNLLHYHVYRKLEAEDGKSKT